MAYKKGDEPQAQYHSVDEGYFATLHVPLLAGRAFTAHDDSGSVPVAIVNEAFARSAWPGQSPIGKQVETNVTNIGPLGARIVQGTAHTVVGLVRDVKNTSLRDAAEPAVYFSVHQFPFREMHIVVRGRATPEQLQTALRDAVRRLDRTVPIANPQTMERVLTESVDPPRFLMLILSLFAALALALAAVGIYGILTYAVSMRRQEIGIRLALGAQPGDMMRTIVRDGVGLSLLGSAAGIVLSYGAGRSLSAFLFGVAPMDPPTLAAVVAVVVTVSAVACVVPGRRAASEDPVRALRGE